MGSPTGVAVEPRLGEEIVPTGELISLDAIDVELADSATKPPSALG